MARVVNSTALFSLGVELNLKECVRVLEGGEYDPRFFSALKMKKFSNGISALVFKTGKVVLIGAKSKADALDAASVIKEKFIEIGYQASVKEFEVKNFVGAVDFKCKFNLEAFYVENIKQCSYEYELFPGLFYLFGIGKAKAIIFRSGKVHITGLRSIRELKQVFLIIKEKLEKFAN